MYNLATAIEKLKVGNPEQYLIYQDDGSESEYMWNGTEVVEAMYEDTISLEDFSATEENWVFDYNPGYDDDTDEEDEDVD